jgi:hypothetical protein
MLGVLGTYVENLNSKRLSSILGEGVVHWQKVEEELINSALEPPTILSWREVFN